MASSCKSEALAPPDDVRPDAAQEALGRAGRMGGVGRSGWSERWSAPGSAAPNRP
jgi:hypothetical protein